jgi:hypothetical protein
MRQFAFEMASKKSCYRCSIQPVSGRRKAPIDVNASVVFWLTCLTSHVGVLGSIPLVDKLKWQLAYYQLCDFSVNKICKQYLGTVLPRIEETGI